MASELSVIVSVDFSTRPRRSGLGSSIAGGPAAASTTVNAPPPYTASRVPAPEPPVAVVFRIELEVPALNYLKRSKYLNMVAPLPLQGDWDAFTGALAAVVKAELEDLSGKVLFFRDRATRSIRLQSVLVAWENSQSSHDAWNPTAVEPHNWTYCLLMIKQRGYVDMLRVTVDFIKE